MAKLRAEDAARIRPHVSQRHGEERSDAAIQRAEQRKSGLLRFARNDGAPATPTPTATTQRKTPRQFTRSIRPTGIRSVKARAAQDH